MDTVEDIVTYVFGLIALTLVLVRGQQVSGIITAGSGFAQALTGALLGAA